MSDNITIVQYSTLDVKYKRQIIPVLIRIWSWS